MSPPALPPLAERAQTSGISPGGSGRLCTLGGVVAYQVTAYQVVAYQVTAYQVSKCATCSAGSRLAGLKSVPRV